MNRASADAKLSTFTKQFSASMHGEHGELRG